MKIGWDGDLVLAKMVKIIPKLFIATYMAICLVNLAFSKSPSGPLAINDFVEFWAASFLVLGGMPASVYDLAQFHQATSQIAGHSVLAPWFYPPTFLLLVAPLALLSYYAALACWLSLGLGAYSLVVWRLAPHPTALWLALAFPATLTNLSYGQNGLFSAALLGGGMLLLNTSPVLAGIFLGLLSFKPNFFILIPVALMAGRHWRALGATLISTLILAISSVLVFGWEPWAAYWSVRHVPMEAVEHGLASLKIMPPYLRQPVC